MKKKKDCCVESAGISCLGHVIVFNAKTVKVFACFICFIFSVHDEWYSRNASCALTNIILLYLSLGLCLWCWMNYLSPKLSIFYAISGLLNIIIIENHSPKQYTYYYNQSYFSSVVSVFWLSCLCMLFYLFTCSERRSNYLAFEPSEYKCSWWRLIQENATCALN